MSLEQFVAVVSALVAVASIGIAIFSLRVSQRSLKEQRHVTKYMAAYTYLASAEAMFSDRPDLMRLHGLELKVLEELEVSTEEVIYLINSFTSAELYHRIEGDWPAELTMYRKNLLDSPTVQKVWEQIIRGRFISDGPFSCAVDDYLVLRKNRLEAGPDD